MTQWQTPLCPFTIEFVPDKLEEIRIAAVDGFYAVPRGGVEIGGVLFGKRVEGKLRILDFRTIKTEYLSGPSFCLSAADQAALRTQLAETRFKDRGISPVGWFVSHTRSAIHLPEKDLEVYRQFFPEPWQVTLVLKPDNLGKVRAGYFFRDAGGLVTADASAAEFTLEAYWGAKQNPPEEVAGEPAALEPIPQPTKVEPARVEPVEVKPAKVEPANVEPPTITEPPVPAPEPSAVAPPLFQFASKPPDWSLTKQILLPMLVTAAIAGAVAVYWATSQ